MTAKMKIALFCLLSVCLIGCDQVTKDLARVHLHHNVMRLFHNTLRLEYADNTGAAMNIGEHLSDTASFWLLSIIPLAVLSLLFIYVIRRSPSLTPLKLCCFALIFAGGIGNIIDRLVFHRHVTDFINVRVVVLRMAVFNIADVCITLGVLTLLAASLLQGRRLSPQ